MCKSCEALTINGVYCHEQGCPESNKQKPDESEIAEYNYWNKQLNDCKITSCFAYETCITQSDRDDNNCLEKN